MQKIQSGHVLIVGLGNPGSKYEHNRHNIGFRIVNKLATSAGAAVWKQKFASDFTSCNLCERKIFLMKPSQYMNLSGKPVYDVTAFFKISSSNVIVAYDDIDIPFGEIRIKHAGSSGGHNGIKSIDDYISREYWRVRFGVGRPTHNMSVADYVLGNFTKEEESVLEDKIDAALNIIKNKIM